MSDISRFTVKANNGQERSLAEYEGKTLLIVNTASKCGFTPQYKGLEKLWEDYGSKGLIVLGFPCDQFAHQEPGDDEAIKSFCELNYGVSFPLMSKVEVNGPGTHPLYAWLKKQAPGAIGEGIKWNFTEFLVDPAGKVTRYAPTTEPEAIRADIERVLAP
jgi:glutathione peroxidase